MEGSKIRIKHYLRNRFRLLSLINHDYPVSRVQLQKTLQCTSVTLWKRILLYERDGVVTVKRKEYIHSSGVKRAPVESVTITEKGKNIVYQGIGWINKKETEEVSRELVKAEEPETELIQAMPCGMRITSCLHPGCYLRYKCPAAGN